MIKKPQEPKKVSDEFKSGTNFMNGIGKRGIAEQSKVNERMFTGDQWHGANVGNRPLVRRNIIKRIGEYKISTLTAAPIAVNYTADGVPNNSTMTEGKEQYRNAMLNSETVNGVSDEIKASVIMDILSDYFKVSAERLKFNDVCEEVVRNAYISGTGIAYTYWDSNINTGLYADSKKSTPIKGDIGFEILDVENVRFGDPNNESVQKQPYIIVSQRLFCDEVKREAKRNKIPDALIEQIKPNSNSYEDNAGERGEREPTDSKRVTVYTKFWKEFNDDGTEYTIKAYKCTDTAPIRYEWDLEIKLYPFAKFCWERRRSCAYGDSEITNMIPNQIAINRAYTAMMWSIMISGLPITVVNGDVVEGRFHGDPGEVLRVYGTSEDTSNAVRFIQPPNFSAQIQNTVSQLSSDTLSDSGATDAALGQERPDNASAIIQLREAALAPMQVYQNRFYSFCEDVGRIWADYWLNLYGERKIKVGTENDYYYVDFKAQDYKNLIINANIDVGASTIWSTSVVIQTLDKLLEMGIITVEQYLERIPSGFIPDKSGLIKEIKDRATEQAETSDSAIIQYIKEQQPELYARFLQMTPDEQAEIINQVKLQSGLGGQINDGYGNQKLGA